VVVADARLEVALGPEPADGGPADAELGGELFPGHHASFEESFLEALELGREADPLNAHRVEGVPSAGAQPALVQEMRDLGVGMDVEEGVDLLPTSS
jgi:hypothetical protein